jgi:adenylate cyclase
LIRVPPVPSVARGARLGPGVRGAPAPGLPRGRRDANNALVPEPAPDHVHEYDPEQEAAWRAILTGDVGGLKHIRRVLGKIPGAPRCKLCRAPLKAPGNILVRPLGFGPSKLNRRLCRACFRSVDRNPGGAEVEVSLLFADVRGSTSIAERIPPQEFSKLISRFYGVAAHVVDARDGIVDKFVGDEVVALFVPGFAGEDHASRALAAARDLLRETGNGGANPWVPVGAGVHTGVAFVGRVGQGDACDFTAVGDTVNTTARLASQAAAGEILVSKAAADASLLDVSALETRTLTLKGKDELIDAVVLAA